MTNHKNWILGLQMS